MRVDVASLDEVAPFRRLHLRPPGHPAEPVKEADLLPLARHFVVRGPEGGIAASATTHPAPSPSGDRRAWQLRAVATAPEWRGRGAGRAVVDACVRHAAAHKATILWCHARVAALGFYGRLGFVRSGSVFDAPVTGPHVYLELSLA